MNDPTPTACRCDRICHPRGPFNPAGLDAIAYRVGDFASFREALLRPLPGEKALAAWRPGANNDLAVQAVEWWAYLADLLTFYNERIARQAYLRTADLDESVSGLIRVLGYRPRPGIGARGVLAAISDARDPFTLPAGYPIASKPAPGKDPQTFELDAPTIVLPGGAVPSTAPPAPALAGSDADTKRELTLNGVIAAHRPGDRLLLLRADWPGTATAYALADVLDSRSERASGGGKVTRLSLKLDRALPTSGVAGPLKLLKATQASHPYHDPSGKAPVFDKATVHLESLARALKVGDPILLEGASAGLADVVARLTNYQEIVWYANPKDAATPGVPTDAANAVPVPLPHTLLTLDPAPTPASSWNAAAGSVTLRFGWQDAGRPASAPPAKVAASATTKLSATAGTLPTKAGTPVLVQDASGKGTKATADGAGAVTLDNPPATLDSPLTALTNLLTVSRGQTVPREVLGSGDASRPEQEFILQKKPLTYLSDPASRSGEGYSSTLRVWVDDVEWHEVPNFYGQPEGARVFNTSEDEQGRTHVRFRGLPSGVENVVATYRYGSGLEVPPAGALSVILKPFPGITSLRNPVSPEGGADPDPREKIRKYAPRSVLTLGRAVSADDYEAIAASAPGVARARSYWEWDPEAQRSLVTIYVGDDAGAAASAATAIAGASDPNRPVRVVAAIPLRVRLGVTLRRDPDHAEAPLVQAARSALLDPDHGLFGANVVRIGGSVFDSEVFAACQGVPGVLGLTFYRFRTEFFWWWWFPGGYTVRHDPGQGRFFRLDDDDLEVTAHV